MERLVLFCLGIPLKILLLACSLSLLVLFIFDSHQELLVSNPEYDVWDAGMFYIIVTWGCCIISALSSFWVFFNLSKKVRQDVVLRKFSFFLPCVFLFFPVLFTFMSIKFLMYLLVPISIFLLQYYHYWRFSKNEKAGVYNKNEPNEDENN